MSDAPVYWSQPNQQVVRDGEPVGVVSDDPDPQTVVPEPEPKPEPEPEPAAGKRRGARSDPEE